MDDSGLVTLPAVPRTAAVARALVHERLRAWRLEHLGDADLLLTSELVTNVLVHTADDPSLSVVRTSAGVQVTVVDRSPASPSRRRHSSLATTGRGLHLLEALADEWGVRVLAPGKAIWFTVTGERASGTGAPVPPPRSEPYGVPHRSAGA